LRCEGVPVAGWVRTASSARPLRDAGLQVVCGDVTDPSVWPSAPEEVDAIVLCASSERGGVEAYRHVYLGGVEAALRHRPGARIVFVSSTSVYGQTNGEWVDEKSPATPATDTGKILREAEDAVIRAGGTVARVGGIYGPRRGVLLQRLRSGDAVIEGDGKRWINQAHREDIIAALRRMIDVEIPGVVNIVDNEPATYLDLYRWACEHFLLPMPPFGPPNLHRKRGLTNKRVANAKLRATGWEPSYPSFREGYPTIDA